jgi:TatD DNase family protein
VSHDTRDILPLVDAHCHVDLYKDFDALCADIEAHQVHTIAVTNAPSVFFHTERLARENPFIYAAAGLHPELVESRGHELPQLLEQISRTTIIGEVGLDYVTNDLELRKKQRAIFTAVLERCADLRGKILTVHSRRSASDVVSLIGANFPCPVILHWFSGTKAQLREAVKNGMYFSVNPAMVRSKSGQALIDEMPEERILAETDGPFVDVGGSAATPSAVHLVTLALAAKWRCSPDHAATRIFGTFERLFATTGSSLHRSDGS